MIIYFMGFLLSLLIIGVAVPIKNRYLKCTIQLIGILPPAIIAGLRDLTVGTDITNYGWFNFETAVHSSNLFSYLAYIKSINSVEPGYSILNFIVSRATSSINVYFFVLNFLTLFFIVLGLNIWADKISFTLGITIYYLLFWGITLNVMRQSLAVAIVFWGTSLYLKKRRILPFILIVFLAASFHQTALLSLMYVPLLWGAKKLKNTKISFGYVVVYALIGVLILELLNPGNSVITTIMGQVPLLGKYYLIFMHSGLEYITVGSGVPLRSMLRQTLPMFIGIAFLWNIRNHRKGDVEANLILITILFISIIFVLVSAKSGVLSRLGMYFSIFQIVAIPVCVKNERGLNKFVFTIIMVSYLVLACALVFKSGSGEIYPYVSQILDRIL